MEGLDSLCGYFHDRHIFCGHGFDGPAKDRTLAFWIVGDIISIPLYFFKGLTLTSFQYIIFTLIAIYGYRSWKKILDKSPPLSLG